ncbi:MAG TPA: outer membrane lipid asymmetry maintenance protein MlaD [Thiolapillus brandeum]|uniref:Outer membrane lipid asymmetry maintenance protein MlaD n=1 Tax=Thiolapillus brandeum TaxID=1076588 RepID=A0A7C5MUZ2_9GAMM|nr:outer membrane lipid asymmetry maintenance protein MlaD [Thiolapillus brandeum]
MKTSKTVEILVGAFVAAALLALFFLAMKVSNLGTLDTSDTFEVVARFDNIGSLKVKAPVTMAGVEVGRVSSIGFDQERYQAVVKLAIYRRFDRIPDDTFAKILTAGLLGEQYVGLDPGGSDTFLEEGSEIEITQSAMVLEEVIGQFIFGKAKEEKQ